MPHWMCVECGKWNTLDHVVLHAPDGTPLTYRLYCAFRKVASQYRIGYHDILDRWPGQVCSSCYEEDPHEEPEAAVADEAEVMMPLDYPPVP